MHPLKHNSMVFSVFIVAQLSPQSISLSPKAILYISSYSLLPISPQHLATTNISVSIAMEYKWNHTIKLFVPGFFKPVYDFKIIHITCISTALLFTIK